MRSDSQERRMAMIAHDQPYWAACARVAGMDEAGRGPLAGNVVTACVIMPSAPTVDWVDDSKKLSALRRDKVYEEILRTALYVGVGRASAQEIDEINILQATFLAMRRALEQLSVRPEIALIDGNRETDFGLPVKTVVKGDSLSANIAAASILAKVTRDNIMVELAQQYPEYGFEIHKGYGTKAHYEALRQYGPCPIHRRSFLKKFYGEK